jgi:surface carbohydrate biosynthesis protein
MKKIILLLKLISRSKFIFQTPKEHDLIVFDEVSANDLNLCVSSFNFFILQTRFEITNKVFLSYKILKQILKNYSKGNLFTVYLISLIELIKPKVVITNIDNSYKFSEVAKILEKKTNFIAIQNSSRHDLLEINYLYNQKKTKYNQLKKYYIPNLFSFGDYEKELYKQLNINVKNIYPIGNLRLANYLHYIKSNDSFSEKYNSDICLVSEAVSPASDKSVKKNLHYSIISQNCNIEKGFVKLVKYTVKFCMKNKMKLIIPCKRDKKYTPSAYKREIEYFKRNLKEEEFNFVDKCLLEKDRDNFSSFRAVHNSKVTVATSTTLLKDKLATGGKILACNLTKEEMYSFPVNGICTLSDCTYEEFEKRLLEIYSISNENYLTKMDKKPDYVMKFDKNRSTINLIKERLSQLGVNQR